jgi:DNA-binding HxlR family transcriptional regulator
MAQRQTTWQSSISVDPELACPIAPVVDIVFSRWTTPILWALHEFGRQRFVELERRLTTITPKVLTQRLRQLERDGLVARTYHPEVPPRVEYEITELGSSLGYSSPTSRNGLTPTSTRSSSHGTPTTPGKPKRADTSTERIEVPLRRAPGCPAPVNPPQSRRRSACHRASVSSIIASTRRSSCCPSGCRSRTSPRSKPVACDDVVQLQQGRIAELAQHRTPRPPHDVSVCVDPLGFGLITTAGRVCATSRFEAN